MCHRSAVSGAWPWGWEVLPALSLTLHLLCLAGGASFSGGVTEMSTTPLSIVRADIQRWGGCSAPSAARLGPCAEVATGAALQQALGNSTVREVVLVADVTVQKADFPEGVVVDREVVLRGERPGLGLYVDEYYEADHSPDPGKNWVIVQSHLVMARLTLHKVYFNEFVTPGRYRGMHFVHPNGEGTPYPDGVSFTLIDVDLVLLEGGWIGQVSAWETIVEAWKARRLTGNMEQMVILEEGLISLDSVWPTGADWTDMRMGPLGPTFPYKNRLVSSRIFWPVADTRMADLQIGRLSTTCQSAKMFGRDYAGDIGVTSTGEKCISWSQVVLQFSNDFDSMVHNHCRAVGSHPGSWCFVQLRSEPEDSFSSPHEIPNQGIGRAYCSVPECEGSEECWRLEDNGHSYNGTHSVTVLGETCLRWDKESVLFGHLPDNHCRNPVGSIEKQQPYCLTGSMFDFNYCDISVCKHSPHSRGGPAVPASTPSNLAGERGSMEWIEDKLAAVEEPRKPENLHIIIPTAALMVLVFGMVLFFVWRHSRGTAFRAHPPAPTGGGQADGLTSMGSLAASVGSSVQTRDTSVVGGEGNMLRDSPASLGLIHLKAVVGSGAFSQVWSGEWRKAKVAVKVVNLRGLTPSTSRRMCEGVEANLIQQLSHPNIVQTFHVYKVVDTAPKPYYLKPEQLSGPRGSTSTSTTSESCGPALAELWVVQELCDMGDLSQFRREEGDQLMTDDYLLKLLVILWEVALALKYLHDMDIVHGDLKMPNVLLRSSGNGNSTAKVADFGMAHRLDGLESYYSAFTAPGDVCYLAPEMLEASKVSAAMDIYSFGALMYEFYSGRPYRMADALPLHVNMVLSGERPTLPGTCPQSYQDLVSICWATNPLSRPTADQLLEMLESIYRDLAGHPFASGFAVQSCLEPEFVRVRPGSTEDPKGYLSPVIK